MFFSEHVHIFPKLIIWFLLSRILSLIGQIRTEEMNLIAQRGIASHYSGRVFVTGLVGRTITNGRATRGKTVCLNNANIALRVLTCIPCL